MRTKILTAAAVAGLGLSSAAQAADSAKTVEAFTILPIAADAQDSFLDVMNRNVVASREEPGNISFHAFVKENGKPGVFVFERWEDQPSLDTHLETPNLQAVNEAAPKALEGEPKTIWLQEVPEIPAAPSTGVDTPRNVVVIFTTTDDSRDAFLKAFAELTPHARDAEGNEAFNIFQVKDEPNKFMVVERWDSEAEHETHLEAEYSQAFNTAIDGLLAADPMESRWLLSEAPRDE